MISELRKGNGINPRTIDTQIKEIGKQLKCCEIITFRGRGYGCLRQ